MTPTTNTDPSHVAFRLPATALGLMSGTSLDGIDVALLKTDGEGAIEPGPAATYAYEPGMREGLRGVLGGAGPTAEVGCQLTLAFAAAIARFLGEQGLEARAIDLVGCHGHTILHRPRERRTWQLGDGALLAAETGIAVVDDFRSADVAAGGEGAPLVPLFHAALAEGLAKPLAVLNLGGVANVTWIGSDGAILAFDTGPGNAALDDWLRRATGAAMDEDGRLARSGKVDARLYATLLEHRYFERPPPKSLDRDEFGCWRRPMAPPRSRPLLRAPPRAARAISRRRRGAGWSPAAGGAIPRSWQHLKRRSA
jgi:anhydro-N-acetylmuramic acid kinase